MGVFDTFNSVDPADTVSFEIGFTFHESWTSHTIHLGVCLDVVPGETNRDNNCSPAFTVAITASSTQAASDAGSESASDAPVVLLPGLGRLIEVTSTKSRVRYVPYADLGTTDGWLQWLRETRALREVERERGYYYAVAQLPYESGGILGIAYFGHPVSTGGTIEHVFAHEVGHNMNLPHAPCGGAGGPDPDFPYRNGRIGMWGYDFAGGRLVDRGSSVRDLMSYCDPIWVSDYHFAKAMEHRLATDGSGRPPAPEPESTLDALGKRQP